ncbi:LysR family transcriptional regulator [Leptolyngbya sp. FACHB-16]|uniref:LysR family transcriptional regulator n=1 Tax=unclassified Leptolyngbya TaxID=2650499 RepID=UPI0016892FA5|nr:LysR family transcriptional regulator [Leptolyngbya sp. FACHB-16]MBD2158918.1 LysR family transcriptional regulator [Leptolyngbya sp. FACHB-16]
MNLLYLSNFELRQICYFVAVVAAGNNFSKAAENLQIDQPPLSQRIRSLEKKLKVELFDRTRRPLQLTPAGTVFLAKAHQALATLDQAITQAQRADRGEIGSLSIGIASSIANTILPDILRMFYERFPDVEVELRELTADQQMQALRDRHLDIGFEVISESVNQGDRLISAPVVEESLVVALPQTHPLATQTQIPLTALANQPLILPTVAAFPFYQQFIHCCEQAGFRPKIVQSVKATWMLTILSLVIAGVGIAILPDNVQNLHRQGIVYRAIQDADLTRQISAMWRSDNTSIVLHEFLKVVQAISGKNISFDT